MPPNPEGIHNPSAMGDDLFEELRDERLVDISDDGIIDLADDLGINPDELRERVEEARERHRNQPTPLSTQSEPRPPHPAPNQPDPEPNTPGPRQPNSPQPLADSPEQDDDQDPFKDFDHPSRDPDFNKFHGQFQYEPKITTEQRREATKRAENMIRAMEREERERLIQRSLDSSGLFGNLFFRGSHVRQVDSERKFLVTPEIRQLIEEYCLRDVTNQMITRSGEEVRRLMNEFGFSMDEHGEFDPPNPQGGLHRILNRIKPTGGNFLVGMGLGVASRAAITSVLGGLLGAVGGGALAGGVLGYARGRREGTESFFSGDAWLNEVTAGLNSGTEAQIELACHKVENILADQNQREQFFNNRTRMEAARLLERYREGIRRLALIRMSNEIAGDEFNGTEEQRQASIARRYTQFCGEMAAYGEQQLMYHYGNQYCQALANEVGIVAAGPGAPLLQPGDQAARREVELSYRRDVEDKNNRRREVVVRATVVGALTGGIAGGFGWYLSHYIAGLMNIGPGTFDVGPQGHHYGSFTNEYDFTQDAFTPQSADTHGLHDLLNDPRCPVKLIGDQIYVGTDQGAALAEATRAWSDQLNFHGMDPNHVADVMHFAGSHINQLPVSPEYGYVTSVEQLQAGIDHIAQAGDRGVFDLSRVFTQDGIREAVSIIAAPDYTYPVPPLWSGWLYVAGAGGFTAGALTDMLRRSSEISATKGRQEDLGRGRNRVEGPFGNNIRVAGQEYNAAVAARDAENANNTENQGDQDGDNQARNEPRGGNPPTTPPTPGQDNNPPTPETPPNEEPPEINFEDLEYPAPTELPNLDSLSLADLIDTVSNNQESNTAALAIENLIDADDEVYNRLDGIGTELLRLHELEDRLNSLGNDQGHQLNRNWITAQSVRILEAWNNQRRARRILNAANTLSSSLPEEQRINTLAEIQQDNRNQIEQAEQDLAIEDLLDGNDEIFDQLRQIGFGTPERREDQTRTLAERLYNNRIANNYTIENIDPNDDQAMAGWDWDRASEIINNLEAINRLETIQQNANSLAQLI